MCWLQRSCASSITRTSNARPQFLQGELASRRGTLLRTMRTGVAALVVPFALPSRKSFAMLLSRMRRLRIP